MQPAAPSLDLQSIAWSIQFPPPTIFQYLFRKCVFSVPLALAVGGIMWYFSNIYVGLVVTGFIFLAANSFLFFLAQVAEGKVVHFKITSGSIAVDEKQQAFTSLDKAAVISLLKSNQVSYDQWSRALPEKSDITVGSIKLQFPNEIIRQKAIRSMLYYLGEQV